MEVEKNREKASEQEIIVEMPRLLASQGEREPGCFGNRETCEPEREIKLEPVKVRH